MLQTLKTWLAESNRIVFFGGAGVSTESGIPDFRSVDGLYSQKFEYPPETIISHAFYERKPEYFFRFYREKMLPLGFEPNVTHKVLARWEREGKLSAVGKIPITFAGCYRDFFTSKKSMSVHLNDIILRSS